MDWFSLFMLIFLGAVAYTQTIGGIFSALIMFVCVCISTALSFSLFEWVAFSFLIGRLGDSALPVAFMGCFLVPLIVLRVAVDIWIRRSFLIPVVIDTPGAAAIGVLTGFLMTGVLAIGIQMVPFGGSFLGHRGLNEETGERNPLWLNPDGLTVSFASYLSDGVFSGSASFEETHPDFLMSIVSAQAAVDEILHLAPPGAIQVVSVSYPDYVFKKTPPKNRRRGSPTYDQVELADGNQWFQVRLALGDEVKDDGKIRFSPNQVRVVGRGRPSSPWEGFSPVAIQDNDRPERAVQFDREKLYAPSKGNEIDLVFEVPVEFRPEFVEFMYGARADLSGIGASETVEPTDILTSDASANTTSPTSTVSSKGSSGRSSGRGDRVSGVRASGDSRFGDSLPIQMTKYRQFNLDQQGGALKSGHVHGRVADQDSGSDPRISRFDVPSDKRMFQLEVEQLRARSGLGKALSFAVRTSQQYMLKDDNGNSYPVVGQYIVASVDGEDYIEVQYFPDDVAASGRGGIRPFAKIKKRDIDGGSRLVFLFLVDPGVRITEFSTGGRPTDLNDLDLDAPR
jgi:hypothetical protein